jgi:hypothetical protein
VKTFTAQEIEAGAKSGQWAGLNQRNGASMHSSGASTFPTRATAPPNPVSLESVLPSQHMVTANLGPMKIFVAPQADFDRLQQTFEAMLKSVQFR